MILNRLFETEQLELEKMLDDFCNLTGLAAVITDKKGNQLSKLSNASEFCTMMRTQGDLCCRSDGIGGKIAAKKGDISIYKCHAGLVDFAAPIFVKGEHIGNILAGQIITNTPLEHDLTQITANTLCIVDSEMKAKYAAIHCMDHETIAKCSRILDILRKYVSERVIVLQQEHQLVTAPAEDPDADLLKNLAAIVSGMKKLEYENAKKLLLYLVKDFYEWNKKSKATFRTQLMLAFAELELTIPDEAAVKNYHNSLFRIYPESSAYFLKVFDMLFETIILERPFPVDDPFLYALAYLQRFYYQKISTQEIADYMNLSPDHFARLFKRKYEISFTDFLIQTRIEASKALLTQTPFTVTEIALELGYQEPNYFTRVFKKVVGIPPTEYREKYAIN